MNIDDYTEEQNLIRLNFNERLTVDLVNYKFVKKEKPYTHPKRDELLKIFNLTHLQALQPQIRLNKLKLKQHEETYDKLLALRIKAKNEDRWLPDFYLQKEDSAVQKYTKRLLFLNKRKRHLKEEERRSKEDGSNQEGNYRRVQNTFRDYDKDEAKRYPIKTILQEHGIQLDSFNKFRIRDEHTPSCVLYPNNTAYDFGSGKYYDSIAIYQELDGCDFITALKELSI